MQFLDMRAPYLELKDELDAAYFRFMDSGWYVLGREVDSFEDEFATYCGAKECVGVSSGLDALCLALEAGGVKAGDEVIVPANTYIATWLAVSQIGATPIPVEPDINTFNLDPAKIEAAVTPKTTAIAVVHLYGRVAEMDKIMAIANKHSLLVLEDAAQSQGAIFQNRRVGNLAHVSAFSFYPAKNIGAFGEAGAVTTNSAEIAEKVRLLRNYGSREKYHNELQGYNRRLDALQAAFLKVKLPHLDNWNKKRRQIAERYQTEFTNISEIITPELVENSVNHQYVIRLQNRDEYQQKLAKMGVPTLIHYPIPPHLSEAYKNLGYKIGDFPITEKLANEILSLPIGPHMLESDIKQVVTSIKKIF